MSALMFDGMIAMSSLRMVCSRTHDDLITSCLYQGKEWPFGGGAWTAHLNDACCLLVCHCIIGFAVFMNCLIVTVGLPIIDAVVGFRVPLVVFLLIIEP